MIKIPLATNKQKLIQKNRLQLKKKHTKESAAIIKN